ncbi:MAG: hypothetical protein ACLUAR_18565 [Pilosibacter sp.]
MSLMPGRKRKKMICCITKLGHRSRFKKNRGMEENYMLFGEMLDEERRQGQKEGLQQGKMDILLKLLQEHKIDVKTAASIMGMNEDEFAKAVKNARKSKTIFKQVIKSRDKSNYF